MSDDAAKYTWTQFVRDTDEHLENICQILKDAEGNEVEINALWRLLRSFQSIKWLSKSMGVLAMEILASSTAEGISDICEGAVNQHEFFEPLILAVVDDLKLLRNNAKCFHEKVEQVTSPEAASFYKNPEWLIPDGKVVTYVLPSQQESLMSDVEVEHFNVSTFLMNLVKDNIPSLSVLTSPECISPVKCKDCNGCSQMVDSIENIAHATEVMGHCDITNELEKIKADMPKKGELITQNQRERILLKLPLVQEMMRLIETEFSLATCYS